MFRGHDRAPGPTAIDVSIVVTTEDPPRGVLQLRRAALSWRWSRNGSHGPTAEGGGGLHQVRLREASAP